MLNAIVGAQTLGWRLKNLLRKQEGQTSSEYLVIAGMVVGIILLIMGIFRTELSSAISTLSGKVKTGASGG
jgi:Flp pilus assembly pilin Flp